MVSMSYVHAYDDYIDCDRIYQETMEEFDGLLAKIEYDVNKRSNLSFFESDSEEVELLTESIADAVSKLGEKIIALIKKIKDFIKDKIDKIKSIFTNKSHQLDKILAQAKKNPQLASMNVKKLVESGNMELADFKHISGYYKEIDNVVKELKKANVDPKSLEGRLYKIQDKFKSGSDKLITAGKVAGAITSIVAVAALFKKTSDRIERDTRNAAKEADIRASEIESTVRYLENNKHLADVHSRMRAASLAAATERMVSDGYLTAGNKASLAVTRNIERLYNFVINHTPVTGTDSRGQTAGQRKLTQLKGMAHAQRRHAERDREATIRNTPTSTSRKVEGVESMDGSKLYRKNGKNYVPVMGKKVTKTTTTTAY